MTWLWPFVALVGLGVLAWGFTLVAQRVPIQPEPMRAIGQLRDSTQEALQDARQTVALLTKTLAETNERLSRLTNEVRGKGDLIVPKPDPTTAKPKGLQFPGPEVSR